MRSKIWLLFGCLSLIVAACGPQTPIVVSDTLIILPGQVWIDAPLPNANLPLAPYKIIFHGANLSSISEFEVTINSNVLGTVPANPAPADDPSKKVFFYGEYIWNPSETGMYVISVRAKDGEGEYGADAELKVTIEGEAAEGGEEDADEEVTEEEEDCIYTAVTNLFCRLGPGSSIYPEIDSFTPGQFANVLGQSQDGVFVAVEGPNFGETCYVPSDVQFGELTGSCDDQPILVAPAIPASPTDSPATDSPDDTPVQGCTVKIIGTSEVSCVVPCPDGAEPGDACTP